MGNRIECSLEIYVGDSDRIEGSLEIYVGDSDRTVLGGVEVNNALE